MPKIVKVRPVLLSAPYGCADDLEVKIHLRSGMRTCGLVEITLEDGNTGLGEGFLAVFAPHVFVELVRLIEPFLIGTEVFDTAARYNDCCRVTDYFSFQGAARHVISACEIAMLDAKAKILGVPVYSLFGGKTTESICLYGSGGDSSGPEGMLYEMDLLDKKGISIFKIRARKDQIQKTSWVMEQAQKRDIEIAVDMGQNLTLPAQTVSDVVQYVCAVHKRVENRIYFLEEALGSMDEDGLSLLRGKVEPRICGGEIVTTAAELCGCIERKLYDFVQPDVTVIGGIGQTLQVCDYARQHGSDVVVHCWGGGVSIMASYHAAFVAGSQLAEWPMKQYPLREALLMEPLHIKDGKLRLPELPGLGVHLTPEIEDKYPFREEAIYMCNSDRSMIPPDESWKS